jgi:hypothetical protein
MRMVIMKKGGEPGDVAINRELVTHVRATPGQFTDIFFGEHRVAVDCTFRQVLAKLCEEEDEAPTEQGGRPTSTWLAGMKG